MIKIPLFPRSDLMAISIPVSSGGCGSVHSRPVSKGAPKRVWELNCPQCEAYLRGDNKPRVIRVEGGDRNKGIPSRMNHVADSDPHWSTTPETIPPTPDEEQVHSRRQEVASQQLQLLQASAAAKAAGFDIPAEALWLLEEKLGTNLVHGTIECMDGHANPAGTKFCGECGVSMKTRASLPKKDGIEDLSDRDLINKHPETAVKLGLGYEQMHVATLKKLCRQQGLPDKGSKAELIERLS